MLVLVLSEQLAGLLLPVLADAQLHAEGIAQAAQEHGHAPAHDVVVVHRNDGIHLAQKTSKQPTSQ